MFHRFIAVVAGTFVLVGAAAAQTALPFALDWKFVVPAAPYFLSIDNGHFSEAGLDVEVTEGNGSLDAIHNTTTALREWIGLVAYRLTGRTDELLASPD